MSNFPRRRTIFLRPHGGDPSRAFVFGLRLGGPLPCCGPNLKAGEGRKAKQGKSKENAQEKQGPSKDKVRKKQGHSSEEEGKAGKAEEQGKQGNREAARKLEKVGDFLVNPLKRIEFLKKSAGEHFLQPRTAER